MSGEKRRTSKKSAPARRIELRAAEREALQALDDVAVSHALHRGELAPVVRYLREIVKPLIQHRNPGQFGSTATIGLLADMLEGRESALLHLKAAWPRRGKPTDKAATALRKIAIGAEIAALIQRGEARKNAVIDTCAKFTIKHAQAQNCLRLFQKYDRHNKAGEPMPLD